MLKFFAFLLGITQAYAQAGSGGYIIFPSQTACLTRSQQMCVAMGCDGVKNKYWWDCSTAVQSGTVGGNAVAAGSFALRIDSGQFGATTNNSVSGGTQGLNAGEQSSLIAPATANASNVFPWVLTVSAFKARFTPPQITAMGASVDPNIQTTWANLGASAVVNLQNPAIQTMIGAAVTDGIITMSNAISIMQLTIAPVPPQ